MTITHDGSQNLHFAIERDPQHPASVAVKSGGQDMFIISGFQEQDGFPEDSHGLPLVT